MTTSPTIAPPLITRHDPANRARPIGLGVRAPRDRLAGWANVDECEQDELARVERGLRQ